MTPDMDNTDNHNEKMLRRLILRRAQNRKRGLEYTEDAPSTPLAKSTATPEPTKYETPPTNSTRPRQGQATPQRSWEDCIKPIVPITFAYKTPPTEVHSHHINVAECMKNNKAKNPIVFSFQNINGSFAPKATATNSTEDKCHLSRCYKSAQLF